MRTCPAGHESHTEDYCDVCGRPMVSARAKPGAQRPAVPPAVPTPCPACQAPLEGRFCEHCGHDSTAPVPVELPQALQAAPGAGSLWFAVVEADREYFLSVQALDGPDAALVGFPASERRQTFPMVGERILIGRRLAGQGIDLADDTGVSHQHALLIAQPGGSWAVEDLGSANGTHLNGHDALLDAHTRVPVAPGDRIYLGAWTRLTVMSASGSLDLAGGPEHRPGV